MQKGYNSFGLYNDADDDRLLVPKSNPALGWTINLSHPHGRKLLIGIVIAIAAGITLSLLAT